MLIVIEDGTHPEETNSKWHKRLFICSCSTFWHCGKDKDQRKGFFFSHLNFDFARISGWNTQWIHWRNMKDSSVLVFKGNLLIWQHKGKSTLNKKKCPVLYRFCTTGPFRPFSLQVTNIKRMFTPSRYRTPAVLCVLTSHSCCFSYRYVLNSPELKLYKQWGSCQAIFIDRSD